MIIPPEAVAAIKLLWSYYLVHVVCITILMWMVYVFVKNFGHAMLASLLIFVLALEVEIFQFLYPQLGDACWDDVFIDAGTVLICFVIFSTIRYKGRRDRKNERKSVSTKTPSCGDKS